MRVRTIVTSSQAARIARWVCEADVVLPGQGRRKLHGRLGAVNDGAFLGECAEPVPDGAILEVNLPDLGAVRAQVRWVLGCRFGARMLGPEAAA
jgi:hypothetical protein